MNRLSLITHLSDKEQMLNQYEILIQEYRNQPDSINVIAICLNNIAALLNKNELLSKSILRFVKQQLLKTLPNALQFIIFINSAKIYNQLGLHSKAFLKAEMALQFYEKFAFSQLNQSEAVLLINGYITLAKSYEMATFEDLAKIRRKSKLLQNGFKSTQIFYENSKKLLVKYVGITHPFYKQIVGLSSQKSALQQRSFIFQNEQNQNQFASRKQTTIRIMRLLDSLKSDLPRIVEFQEIYSQTPQKAFSRLKTTNEDSINKGKFYRIKRISKIEDDQETTIETKKKRKSFKMTSISNLEKIITNKVEQQVQLHFQKKQQEDQMSNSKIDLDQKYLHLQNEINKIEKEKQGFEKQGYEWKQQIKLLQEEINQLRIKIIDNEQVHIKEAKEQHFRHLEQIKHLNEQNQQLKLQMNKTFHQDKNYTTYNNSIDDHQCFFFTDNFTGQMIYIPLLQNISFIFKQENIQIEVQQLQQTLKLSAKINDKILNEFIEISQLQDFLQYTQYIHTLPYPIKYLNNFKTFIQYLIVPFVQIVSEQNETKIAIWPQPQGLLLEQQIIFLNDNCQWWIHNIGLMWFRVTIYSQADFIIQLDIRYDQITFQSYFKQENLDEYEMQEKEEILQYLSKINSQQIQILESSKNSIHNTYYLPSVQILDKQKLIQLINQQIKYIEQFLNLQNIHSTQQIKVNKTVQIQQISIQFNENKSQIQAVLLEEGKCMVRLRNCYLSHAPQNKQINADGCFEITNEFLKQRYGISFDNLLRNEDKIYFYEKLLESFTLQTFLKPFDEDDDELFKSNGILLRELNFGGTNKIFYDSNNYKIPINFSLIGANDIPQFVKIDLYNEESIEQHCILLNITEEYWIRPVITQMKQDKKKKQQKYNKEFKVAGQYYLSQILQQCGWFILEHHIYMNEDKDSIIKQANWNNILI
ncbi:unnamed protein product (macronuclear) [Paramecium tetraurelia]|uniref:Uncharacterized protein n=1 Tax=Paramecium tetraurelia TaxID=5888 RepID=A0CWK5_PARTE|nr:uncharacterized protein GSPATT00001375001 [Paramecium tetraurelia]CAK75172.1 unnamed protein product [Paramecium tetraurelia]|eukprot:XP_001442569.1 hypothetical protein (macronuclear) [Paramecium tetraurelia strain d4-2]